MAADPTRSSVLPPAISAYIAARAAPADQVLLELQTRTAQLGRAAGMQISADQGALLTLLTRLVGARQAVEVGTFTGFSSICIARGLAPGGHLLCCDVSEEYTAIAREAWVAAGVDDRIELRLAPGAGDAAGPARRADDRPRVHRRRQGRVRRRTSTSCVPRVRPGGLLLVDNTLWSGRVVDDAADDADTIAIRAFNDKVAADDRVESYLLPIGDGLTLIRKH